MIICQGAKNHKVDFGSIGKVISKSPSSYFLCAISTLLNLLCTVVFFYNERHVRGSVAFWPIFGRI